MGCSSSSSVREHNPYITGGKVVDLYFKLDGEEYTKKKITIHNANNLRKAIEMYQEVINKEDLEIKKAIYEPSNTKLNLDQNLNELDINFADTIIVYLG